MTCDLGLYGVKTSVVKTSVVDISLGNARGLAVSAGGQAWSWGWNAYGRVGDGTTKTRLAGQRRAQAPGRGLCS